MTMEDLAAALKEYGMNVEKPQYLAARPGLFKDSTKKR